MPTYAFYLAEGDPLVRHLEASANRSADVRDALRAFYATDEQSLLVQMNGKLDRLLRQGVIIGKPERGATGGGDEVDASALDEMLSAF